MTQRSKLLVVFLIVYLVVAAIIYFGLKYRLKNNFSEKKVNTLIVGQSKFRDKTDDLCKYQILGDPKKTDYVKVEIHCKDDKKANSTLSLSAIEDKTYAGFLTEYERIIGFNKKILGGNFSCFMDGKEIEEKDYFQEIKSAVTLKCIQKND